LGSCFAENIGQRLENLKFKIDRNPFGILYHPISIFNGLERLLDNENFTENELFAHHGLWHSFAHHGGFSKIEKTATLNGIQQRFTETQTALQNTNQLLLTFGTAYVFEYKKTGKIVANCHKLPNQDFNRRCLTIEEITNTFIPFLQQLKKQNPPFQTIATISPIRHIRDGLIENQKSKAILRVALTEICETLDFVHYFPSYEILMDDLRDYRFYEVDMIHPSQVAMDYIWEHFQEAFFDQKTRELNGKVEKIRMAMQHRPLNPKSEEYRQFLRQQLKKVEALKETVPFLNFNLEEAFFKTKGQRTTKRIK